MYLEIGAGSSSTSVKKEEHIRRSLRRVSLNDNHYG